MKKALLGFTLLIPITLSMVTAQVTVGVGGSSGGVVIDSSGGYKVDVKSGGVSVKTSGTIGTTPTSGGTSGSASVGATSGNPTTSKIASLINGINVDVVARLGVLFLAIALVVFFFGIVRFILAQQAGDSGKANTSKMFILWSLIALFAAFSVYGIIKFAQGSLGINNNTTIDKPCLNFVSGCGPTTTGGTPVSVTPAPTTGGGIWTTGPATTGGDATCTFATVGQACAGGKGVCKSTSVSGYICDTSSSAPTTPTGSTPPSTVPDSVAISACDGKARLATCSYKDSAEGRFNGTCEYDAFGSMYCQ